LEASSGTFHILKEEKKKKPAAIDVLCVSGFGQFQVGSFQIDAIGSYFQVAGVHFPFV